MSWLLKQAEDILNKVDQQANVAINQHATKSTTKQTNDEHKTDSSTTLNTTNKSNLNTNRTTTTGGGGNRRNKKNEDTDLIDYLNSPTPVNNKSNRLPSLGDTTRTASTPDMSINDLSNPIEQSLSSKSASGTPRSITPAIQNLDEDEGLVLVSY